MQCSHRRAVVLLTAELPTLRTLSDDLASFGIETTGAQEYTNYPLDVSVDDLGTGFSITAGVSSRAASVSICGLLEAVLDSLVSLLSERSDALLSSVQVLPEPVRRQILTQWNDTTRTAWHGTVAELFERQVTVSGDDVAVVFEGESLSYRQLNARANRLAGFWWVGVLDRRPGSRWPCHAR